MIMKRRDHVSVLVGFLVAQVMLGCAAPPPEPGSEEKRDTNAAMVQRIFDQAADNAIVSEYAVYPYHFLPNQAALNELGERHVAALAAAYRTTPGTLVMPRGDTPPELQQTRVKAVLQSLSAAGVDTDRLVSASSDLPGGPGMSSARAERALENAPEAPQARPAPQNGATTKMESR